MTNQQIADQTVTTLPCAAGRDVADDDHESVRDLATLTGDVTRDGLHLFEGAVARLAEDGTIARALAVRLDLRADRSADDGIGEYDICELGVHPIFGVVGVTVLEEGHGSRAEACDRALEMLRMSR